MRYIPLETFEKHPLLPNLPPSPKVMAGQAASSAQILILEILKVFLAVPMKIGRVKIFAFLDLEQN
jgi:hypothetical protein